MRESSYIDAVETRMRWLRWLENGGGYSALQNSGTPEHPLRMYYDTLRNADTFFVNRHFCELIDIARQEIPDELLFDLKWMQAKQGFMWLAKPFVVPAVDVIPQGTFSAPDVAELVKSTPVHVDAVGWVTTDDGGVEFLCFQDIAKFIEELNDARLAKGNSNRWRPKDGFGAWSYFGVTTGTKLIDKIRNFETRKPETGLEGFYKLDRTTDMLHEIRWVFAAMHLMSQKLAVTVEQPLDRHTRRRTERENPGRKLPALKIVTLRRLEEERKKSGAKAGDVNWQWQWRVEGHGRWQWYPSKKTHEYIWIDSFIKGPMDKPLKPPQHVVYVAKR